MSDAFSLKKGAGLPARVITLTGNGLANLDDVDTDGIKFVYRLKDRLVDAPTPVEIAATIVSSEARTILVVIDGETMDVGRYEWHVRALVGGKAMYFPERGFYYFAVTETIE